MPEAEGKDDRGKHDAPVAATAQVHASCKLRERLASCKNKGGRRAPRVAVEAGDEDERPVPHATGDS